MTAGGATEAVREAPGDPAARRSVMAWPAFRNRGANPYNSLLYASVSRRGWRVEEFSPAALLTRAPPLWHIHWPDKFLNRRRLASAVARSVGVLVLAWLARRRGTRIVWTVHNLQSHDRRHPRLERYFWKAFTTQVDGLVGLTESGLHAARSRFPALARAPGFVVPHGHYRDEYPRVATREDARRVLGIPPQARVLLFFGRIREYKDVPGLIRTFRNTRGADLALLIAGCPDSASLADEIRALATSDSRVRILLDHVPDGAVPLWFGAADLVVLPYSEILNSGTALLALSFDRPVLLPSRGAMEELRATVSRRWVRTYAGDLFPRHLEESLRWAAAPRESCAPLYAMEWERIGAAMAEAYTEVARRTTHRARPSRTRGLARAEAI